MTRSPFILRKSEGLLPIPDLIDRLSAIDPARVSSGSGWSVARSFAHLAQGVEFSITGYPELKPALFRATLGRVAFHLFHAKGAMSHATSDPIPGEVMADGDPTRARDRLITALQLFEVTENFQPHFAYGRLCKKKYAAAHAMHIADHMDDFRV